MLDGWGAPNGLLPADLMHLTDDQVEGLFLAPMRALAKAARRRGEGDDPPADTSGGEIDSPEAFRREFEEFTGPQPPEFWAAKYREYDAARRAEGR